jgi:hypothetical protein
VEVRETDLLLLQTSKVKLYHEVVCSFVAVDGCCSAAHDRCAVKYTTTDITTEFYAIDATNINAIRAAN